MEKIVRDVERRTGHVLDERSSRAGGWARRPYRSLSAERLHAEGFVQETEEGTIYYAPDEEVLLSDVFLDHHCLRPILGEGATDGWIGLAFRPVHGRTVPDISGTLWLEGASWQLQRLDFRYEGLRRPTPVRDVGGRVRFRRLPDGTWIVPEWTIRTPLMGRGIDASGRPRVFQTGVREEGGAVLEVRRGDGDVLLTSGTATLEGLVVDSLGLEPVPGATVELVGAGVEARTGPEGTFAFTRLEPGDYSVAVTDAGVEALGDLPPRGPLTLAAGEVGWQRIRLPTLAEVLAARCGLEGVRAGERDGSHRGVLTGRVMEAKSGLPLLDASVVVEVASPPARFEGVETGTTVRRIELTVDEDGRFLSCGLPSRRHISLQARWGPVTGHAVGLRIEEGRVVVRDLPIALEGTAMVHGTVIEMPSGVPVEGARIELADGIQSPTTDAAVTDDRGRFRLEGVPVGRRRLSIDHPGYRAGQVELAVRPGEEVEVEVELPVIAPGLDALLPGLSSRLRQPEIRVIQRAAPSRPPPA